MVEERTFLRPRDGRMIGGVCAAVARRMGCDVTIVRTVWALSVAIFGLGLVAYLLAWTVVPEE